MGIFSGLNRMLNFEMSLTDLWPTCSDSVHRVYIFMYHSSFCSKI